MKRRKIPRRRWLPAALAAVMFPAVALGAFERRALDLARDTEALAALPEPSAFRIEAEHANPLELAGVAWDRASLCLPHRDWRFEFAAARLGADGYAETELALLARSPAGTSVHLSRGATQIAPDLRAEGLAAHGFGSVSVGQELRVRDRVRLVGWIREVARAGAADEFGLRPSWGLAGAAPIRSGWVLSVRREAGVRAGGAGSVGRLGVEWSDGAVLAAGTAWSDGAIARESWLRFQAGPVGLRLAAEVSREVEALSPSVRLSYRWNPPQPPTAPSGTTPIAAPAAAPPRTRRWPTSLDADWGAIPDALGDDVDSLFARADSVSASDGAPRVTGRREERSVAGPIAPEPLASWLDETEGSFGALSRALPESLRVPLVRLAPYLRRRPAVEASAVSPGSARVSVREKGGARGSRDASLEWIGGASAPFELHARWKRSEAGTQQTPAQLRWSSAEVAVLVGRGSRFLRWGQGLVRMASAARLPWSARSSDPESLAASPLAEMGFRVGSRDASALAISARLGTHGTVTVGGDGVSPFASIEMSRGAATWGLLAASDGEADGALVALRPRVANRGLGSLFLEHRTADNPWSLELAASADQATVLGLRAELSAPGRDLPVRIRLGLREGLRSAHARRDGRRTALDLAHGGWDRRLELALREPWSLVLTANARDRRDDKAIPAAVDTVELETGAEADAAPVESSRRRSRTVTLRWTRPVGLGRLQLDGADRVDRREAIDGFGEGTESSGSRSSRVRLGWREGRISARRPRLGGEIGLDRRRRASGITEARWWAAFVETHPHSRLACRAGLLDRDGRGTASVRVAPGFTGGRASVALLRGSWAYADAALSLPGTAGRPSLRVTLLLRSPLGPIGPGGTDRVRAEARTTAVEVAVTTGWRASH